MYIGELEEVQKGSEVDSSEHLCGWSSLQPCRVPPDGVARQRVWL